MDGRRIVPAACAAALAIVLASCGESPTPGGPITLPGPQWRLNAGGAAHSQAYQGLQFYPNTITVDAGDTVSWTFASGEPHTVTFLASSQATPPPPTDPSAPAPAGGSSYDGSTYTSSGFRAGGAIYSLQFTKPGTYTYYCLLHGPEMQGTVVVNPDGTAYPFTEDAYSSQAVAQTQSDLNDAASWVSALAPLPASTVDAGLSGPASPSHATVLRFLTTANVDDSTITVPAGTTITWVNAANNAPHTVTFPIAGQPLPTLPGDPFTPPMGGSTYDGTQVTNSGVLAPGQSYKLTFTKAGTFVYYCLFHDGQGMAGTVVVQ